MALKTELVSKAKKLKIPRYGKLTKAELEKAIKAVTGKKSGAKTKKKETKGAIRDYNCKGAMHSIQYASEYLKDETQNLFTKDAQWNKQMIDSALAALRQAGRYIKMIK